MPIAIIQMPLLNEGTDVWRPVTAEQIGDVFQILGPVPEGEEWAFPPGQTVAVMQRVFADGSTGLAATAYPAVAPGNARQ